MTLCHSGQSDRLTLWDHAGLPDRVPIATLPSVTTAPLVPFDPTGLAQPRKRPDHASPTNPGHARQPLVAWENAHAARHVVADQRQQHELGRRVNLLLEDPAEALKGAGGIRRALETAGRANPSVGRKIVAATPASTQPAVDHADRAEEEFGLPNHGPTPGAVPFLGEFQAAARSSGSPSIHAEITSDRQRGAFFAG